MNRPMIILASASKRRSQILSSCGIKHTVLLSGAKEIQPRRKNIISSVIKNAERKVRGVYKEVEARKQKAVIIGADTLVTLGNEVIGKPKDGHEAKELLRKFSGHEMGVYTGLFVVNTQNMRKSRGHEKSTIHVREIKDKDIHRYFVKLGSFDKAGGFSIEGVGSVIFDNIKGSYFNILGLPMQKLGDLFSEIGLDLLDFCR